MTDHDPIQCPVCGWTGQDADVQTTPEGVVCPVCGETVAVE